MVSRIRKLLRNITLVFVLVVTLTVMAGSTPALAITNGQPDGDDHPYVCFILIFDIVDGEIEIAMAGSGVLIAPDIVLTAGHVAAASYYSSYTYVSTSPEIQMADFSGYIPGTPYVHPQFQYYFEPGLFGTLSHDVGIIALDAPIILDEYGELPVMGAVDDLAQKTPLDIVGYGANYRERPSGEWVYLGERYQTMSELITSKNKRSDEFIKCTANPSKGKGGSSYGDSGGPVLLRDTNTIVGLVSFSPNDNCTGVEYESRVDTPEMLDWINGFLQ